MNSVVSVQRFYEVVCAAEREKANLVHITFVVKQSSQSDEIVRLNEKLSLKSPTSTILQYGDVLRCKLKILYKLAHVDELPQVYSVLVQRRVGS